MRKDRIKKDIERMIFSLTDEEEIRKRKIKERRSNYAKEIRTDTGL